jgi:CheY-like chemotaxis protein
MSTPPAMKALLVEDNPSDVLMIRESLVSAGLALELAVVWNGQEALDYLRRSGGHAAAPRPDVVLLDINLPILSGREVLAAMAADSDLRTIPVVILTGSRFEEDVTALYSQERCLFLVKPFDFPAFVELTRRVTDFAASFRTPAARRGPAGGFGSIR